MNRFTNRVVLVTGGASGIGSQMCEQFAAEGATVYGADIRKEGVPDTSIATQLDVTDAAAYAAVVARIMAEQGRIDVLCSNAGTGSVTSVVDCTVEEWEQVFAVNVRGVFLGAKLVLPHMLAAGRGAIVNTASAAGLVGLKDRASYCASKGAVIALTKQIAVQYASTGVRCNCICPGTVDSPWVGRLLDLADDPTEARQALTDRQPIGRLGDPREIAAGALYLASDDAAFITGSSLVMDGGLTAS